MADRPWSFIGTMVTHALITRVAPHPQLFSPSFLRGEGAGTGLQKLLLVTGRTDQEAVRRKTLCV